MRVEITQKIMCQALLLGKNFQGGCWVARDAQNLGFIVYEVGLSVTDSAQLTGANPSEREWIEHDDHILFATEIREGDGFAILIGESEIGREISNSYRHVPKATAWPLGPPVEFPASWCRH